MKLKVTRGIYLICSIINGCKIKKKIEKTRHVKNKDKFKKYILG